jgi:hypothetical protein
MQRNWSNKYVDLNLLAEQINEFFKNNDFEVTVNETNHNHQLIAKGSSTYEMNGQVLVTVCGKPEEFSIELEFQTKKGDEFFSHSILLTTLFGGGYLLKQYYKTDESWIKFKRDFWEHIDRIVTYLSGSSSGPVEQR